MIRMHISILTNRQDEVQAEQNRMQKVIAEWAALPGKIGRCAKPAHLDQSIDN